MIILQAKDLELRGVQNKQTKNGNVYYLINCEDVNGNAYSFYCKDIKAIPEGLKKGSSVDVYFEYRTYQGNESLTVVNIEKNDEY